MIITPLGHTEFLVDIENKENKNVRILVDSWLSDYAIGDLMERTVKVKLDKDTLKSIDAIYISHAHCDHFDPYTLIEIYGDSRHVDEGDILLGKSGQDFSSSITETDGLSRNDKPQKPLLILPFTLRYLESLLSEYLPDAEIIWLENKKPFHLHGIEITGYMWTNPVITNEDDVMMLAISSERELVFAEIDTVPDMEDEEVQKSLYKVFTRKNYDTACYLASRNCLEGQIPYYDIALEKRKAYRDHYIAGQKEEIAFQYERYEYEEFAHHPKLFALPGFVRGFIGQGIAYPQHMSEELFGLALFPLDELVSIENDYAKNFGYSFPQKALIPGRQYRVENGGIEAGRKECPIGELLRHREERSDPGFQKDMDCRVESHGNSDSPRNDKSERIYATGPLIPRELSESEVLEGKKKILEVLNTRFLPYWSASPVASLRDALIKNGGIYRIELKVPTLLGGTKGDTADTLIETKSGIPVMSTGGDICPEGNEGADSSLHSEGQEHERPFHCDGQIQKIIFEYSTARSGFIEVPYIENMHIDEDYWFIDILDFLGGKLEMYSSFWHALNPKKIYRLWTCLGANFMNNDLVEKKYRYHFARAKKGETAESFVLSIFGNFLGE